MRAPHAQRIDIVNSSAVVRPAAAPADFAAVRNHVAPAMKQVDALIRARLASDVVLVNSVAEHIVAGGGKRLRPMLVLLAAEAAGYRGEQHHQAAAIVEFIHTATLLHDDVVDESDLRRGRSTANSIWGNSASILVGDFLYSRAFQLMVELDRMRVMQLLADTTNQIAQGEVLQLMHLNNPDTDEPAYLQVIERKTAVLFAAAAQLGAILADAPPAQESALREFGHELGMAFQIADDWLDYVSDAQTLGKNVGDDLAEGKATLPLIRALATAPDDVATRVRAAISAGDLAALPEIVTLIRSSGALDYAHARAQRHADAAIAALATLPSSPALSALRTLAVYATTRDR
jgi:octaprenyl-diphosphate synthase